MVLGAVVIEEEPGSIGTEFNDTMMDFEGIIIKIQANNI